MNKLYELVYRWAKRKRFPHMVGETSRRTFSANGFKVTQHALIRYFERVEGYNISDIINGLTNSVIAKDGDQLVGNIKVFVSGHTIITVLPHKTKDIGNRIKGLENL